MTTNTPHAPNMAVSVLGEVPDDCLPTAEDVRGLLAATVPAPNLAALLEKAIEALRPLSDAVFNDNGDMTVSRPLPSYDECVKAYFVVKQIRIALETPPAPQMAVCSAEPDFAASIRRTCSEEASNGAACGWTPCTGCYDTEDGHPTAHYPHSKIFGCDVGSGCSECGGLGVVFQYWSPEDLEDMQRDCVSETQTATQDELSYQCDACSVPGYPPNTKCECTSIQQDESCPVGYPSLLCEVCDGKGIIPTPAPQVMPSESPWQWWAGEGEEWLTVGPEDTREAIISAATNDSLGEFEHDGGGWNLSFYIVEARKDPLRLADWIHDCDLLDYAEECLADSDRVGSEFDEGPWFTCSAAQKKDLQERINRACNEWQAAHQLVFSCSTFSHTRNEERVIVELPSGKGSEGSDNG